jgi:hypothetical protein
MTRKLWRRVSWPIVFAGLITPFTTNCGAKAPGAPSAPTLPAHPAGHCPDMAKADAIASFDFGKEFQLQTDVATKVRAGAEAAAEMKALSAKIDSDLKKACGDLARDLGAAGDYKDGQEACKAAVKALGDSKAKLGAKAKVTLDVTEPHCGVDVSAYADCAGRCDASVSPGQAEVKCEPGQLQGECAGKCQGECEASASATCTGECSGSCDAEIKGACSGACSGKCDGKPMPASTGGRCEGVCEGPCDGRVKATCQGQCGGQCKIRGQAECQGTCSGSCSVEMKAPKCTGAVEPPKLSAECKAKCDASLQAHAECTPAHVVARVVGGADIQSELAFRKAIEKNMGAVLNVAVGTAKSVERLAGEMKVVLEGVQATVKGAGDPMTVSKLSACVAAPFSGALDAVSSVHADVSVSAAVQASASGSASAGAKSG